MKMEMKQHLQSQHLTCFAKRLQPQILVLMGDSLSLAELLKTVFHLWCDTVLLFALIDSNIKLFDSFELTVYLKVMHSFCAYCRIISSKDPLKSLLPKTCMVWSGNLDIFTEVIEKEKYIK